MSRPDASPALAAVSRELAELGPEQTATFSVAVISLLQVHAVATDAQALNRCLDIICGVSRRQGGQLRNDAASLERILADEARGHGREWAARREAERLAQRDGVEVASHYRRLMRKL
jgi:hypothetical protein